MYRFSGSPYKSVAASSNPVEAELLVLLGQINVVSETGVTAIHRVLHLLTTSSGAISQAFLQSMYERVKQDRDHYYPEIEHDCNIPLPMARYSNSIELENAEPGFYDAFARLF